jgi:predicted aconitase
MDLLCRYGMTVGATDLVEITSAHIDSCLYHGQVSLDFVAGFSALNTRVSVQSTLNVGALDSLNPELHQGESELIELQRELTNHYVALGCLPTMTCAPYQRQQRPGIGEQIAWAESNAIVFANSVLGARTERYGDFIDLCAAITGRVPNTGLHQDQARLATLIVEVATPSEAALDRDVYFAAVGYCLGKLAGSKVAALIGLPDEVTEDELKALGAAAASAGAVAMFHVVGVTPEALTMDQATGSAPGLPVVQIGMAECQAAVDKLCPVSPGEMVAAVCLGTPHYSYREFHRLAKLVAGRHSMVEFYVSTSREIAREIAGEPWFDCLKQFGVKIVVDTCTYLAPVVRNNEGVILTNSGKWAHYGPGNLRRRIGLVTLGNCVKSAETGYVVN